jgi:hypothetical protein
MFSMMKKRLLLTAIISLITGGWLAGPAAAEQVVWEGYLYLTEDGDLGVGKAIIAMSTFGSSFPIVGKELAPKLKPLASDLSYSTFFWNYGWFGDPAEFPPEDIKKVPRVLVRLRGDVQKKGDLVMVKGQLQSAEFLSEPWLKNWQQLARMGMRYGYLEGGVSETKAKEMAPKVLALVQQMKLRGNPTDPQRELVAKINPNAKVVRYFQNDIEASALSWLRAMNEKYRLELKGLTELGQPPEHDVDKWFLAAPNKKEFFANVGKQWKGDLGELGLYYYRSGKDGGLTLTVLAFVRLDDMLDTWSEEEFRRFQASTKEMKKRTPD